jgi:hypothetical protein
VAGGFTKNKPQAPKHSVFVGVVERANAGNGLIYVKPQNGVELDELHNVRITNEANNDIIRYNSTLSVWENKTVESILQFDTVPLVSLVQGAGQQAIRWLSAHRRCMVAFTMQGAIL